MTRCYLHPIINDGTVLFRASYDTGAREKHFALFVNLGLTAIQSKPIPSVVHCTIGILVRRPCGQQLEFKILCQNVTWRRCDFGHTNYRRNPPAKAYTQFIGVMIRQLFSSTEVAPAVEQATRDNAQNLGVADVSLNEIWDKQTH